jgi:hypothetical protein
MSINRVELLEAFQSIKLRVEKQPAGSDLLASFVPVVDFAGLWTANTNLIFGRHGTGKTHLLRAFSQYCRSNFEKRRILPVYIDFRDMDLGSIGTSISVEHLLSRFYRRFMAKIVECVGEFSEEVITVPLLETLFGGEAKTRKNEVNSILTRLRELLNHEVIEERIKEYVRKVENSKEGASKIQGKIGLSSGISLTGPTASLTAAAGITAEEVEKEKEKVEVVYHGLAVIDYESIREELEKLIDKTGAEAIIVLADEWSSVNMNVQPLLAEMIRKTIAISNKIFLKVGALQYLTRTSVLVDPPQKIGLQSGIDITVLADMDRLLNFDVDKQASKDFLTLVAYRHVATELPAVNDLSMDQFEAYLTEELFETPGVYLEVVRAAEGNPRDFLAILSSCCTSARAADSKKITAIQAISAAAMRFRDDKAPELRERPDVLSLYTRIFKSIVQNRQKLFLISADKAHSDDRLQQLWHYRFIHLVSASYQLMDDDNIPTEYCVYSMDYGKILSLKIDKRGEEIVAQLDATTDRMVSAIGSEGILSGMLKVLTFKFMRKPLARILGTHQVAEEGIEHADISKLVQSSILDHLLV